MRRGERHTASLLERHSFLERFGHATTRALALASVEGGEAVATRQLFVAIQQMHLDGRL
jgi:hypothetical protein